MSLADRHLSHRLAAKYGTGGRLGWQSARCCSRLDNTGHSCRSRTVNESLLEQTAIDAINQVLCKKDDFLKTLQTNIATVIKQGDNLSPEVIDTRLRELQKELLKKANQKDDYDAIADEILRLRDMRKQSEVDSVIKDEQMKQINDLQDFIRSQPTTITEFDEVLIQEAYCKDYNLCRSLCCKIQVWDYNQSINHGSVKNFVALVKNGSFLVRITDMTILIEKEFIYGSSKRPNPTDYYRKQHYQCG